MTNYKITLRSPSGALSECFVQAATVYATQDAIRYTYEGWEVVAIEPAALTRLQTLGEMEQENPDVFKNPGWDKE